MSSQRSGSSYGSSNSSLFEFCRHRSIDDRSTAILYCLFLAASYVAALYLLVPSKVRKLSRDHHLQIQYRSMASILVAIGAIVTYPYLFCDDNSYSDDRSSDDNGKNEAKESLFSLRQIMLQPQFLAPVLLHTVVLYLGPIAASLVRVYEIRKQSINNNNNSDNRGNTTTTTMPSYPVHAFQLLLQPDLHSFLTPDSKDEFWKNMRNFVVAPWTEEVIFRGCMIPPLLASGMSVLQVTILAPLFFGVAHIHHAATRLANGERWTPVLFITLFQFVYTSLFGMYASYAFLSTGSVLAVSVSHTYCNWMGLPDLSFVQLQHPMYKYRILLLASYLIGVFAFKFLLKPSNVLLLLLPHPAILPTMITRTI